MKNERSTAPGLPNANQSTKQIHPRFSLKIVFLKSPFRFGEETRDFKPKISLRDKNNVSNNGCKTPPTIKRTGSGQTNRGEGGHHTPPPVTSHKNACSKGSQHSKNREQSQHMIADTFLFPSKREKKNMLIN